VGGTNPRPPDHHDLLPGVDILLYPELAVPPEFQIALDDLLDRRLPHISVGVGEVRRVIDLQLRVPQVLRSVEPPGVEGLAVPAGQLDVLLRHRLLRSPAALRGSSSRSR
jgi:hypothetical protein